MAVLSTNVKLYLEANGKVYKTERDSGAFLLRNDRDERGDYIHTWNVDGLAKPTEEQLNALGSQANDLEALNQVYANRQAEYPPIKDLVIALYDSDDKAAIDSKRAEIKLKYPKPVA